MKPIPTSWRGLSRPQAQQLQQAVDWLSRGDTLMSGQLLLDLQRSAPQHAEVQRWAGVRHARCGEWADAAAALGRAAEGLPQDFGLWYELARARECSADYAGALHALRAAAGCAQSQREWQGLSEECDRQGHNAEALQAVERALAFNAREPKSLLQRVRCHVALGQAELAAADCRTLIANDTLVAQAWFSLVDLKTVRLTEQELELLQRSADACSAGTRERVLLDFALGRAFEEVGRHAEALARLQAANRGAQANSPWDEDGFHAEVQSIRAAFLDGTTKVAAPQGREVIFLVGMPRSGSTLVEQVLASHSQLEGASELPYLKIVVDEESRRRGSPFPGWVPSATAADWTRMGQRYLQLTARWRMERPIATDKLPENWLLAAAALRMLPDARVIDCRRDALETCWSCYKQLFAPRRVGFTYDFETLADYWRASTSLGDLWAQRFPDRYRVLSYEALTAAPEAEIRALLEFCDLAFEPGCLNFHQTQRAIRTASALQVRKPLSRASMPAAAYGSLLDPLRSLLAPNETAAMTAAGSD
jgi:tetratricopeptide (TPR) repeat protein